MNKCSYMIPKSGTKRWQQERPCQRPAQNDGRCLIHNYEKLEKTRRRKIDKLAERIRKLGGKLFYAYNISDDYRIVR